MSSALPFRLFSALFWTLSLSGACLLIPAPVAALEVDTTATLVVPDPRFAADPEPTPGPSVHDRPTTGLSFKTVDFSHPMLLATWKGGSFTSEDLSATLVLRRPPSAEGLESSGYAQVPAQRWRRVVRDLVYELAVVDRAREEGLTSATPEIASVLREARRSAQNRSFFQTEVARRLPAAESRLAREYYDNNLLTRYTRPEKTILTSLQVPLYDEVVAEAGDTLAGIARRLSGTPEARWDIRRGTEPYAHRMPQGKARTTVPFVDVKPGEKLLVPVNPEERERRLALARQLRERLADGDAVTTAAATVTSPTIRLAVNGKLYTPDFDRMDPATVLAIRTLTTGTQVQAVTQPLEGPFGYDLFVLMARLTTSTVSFKDAEKGIYETLKENETIQRRLQDELRQQIFDDLRTTHALEINTQALERGDYGGEDPLTGSTWIIRTKGFTYTLDDYLKELGTANKSWGTLSPAERITAAKSSPLVLRHLVTIESERTQVEAEPEFLREIRSREIQEIAKEWIRRDALKDAATTEGVIREYYLKHIDRYTSASMVTVREITRRVDPGLPPSQKAEAIAKARKALEALRPEVSRSKEDFERVARRQSASISTRSRGGLIGTVPIGYRSAVVEAQLRKLRVGEVTPPIVVGSEVVMLRLDEFVGGVVQPFEVAGPLVVRDWLNEVPVKRRLARRDRVLREANFQLHF